MVGIVIPLSFPTFQRRLQTCHSGGAENRPANQSRAHYWSRFWRKEKKGKEKEKAVYAPSLLLVSITKF